MVIIIILLQCDLIEKHIEKELAERIEHFDMSDFAAQLS